MAEPLASVADLGGRLGRSFVDSPSDQVRAELLLADASAAVRAYTGQLFTAGTSAVRVRSQGGRARLPQRPVTGVTSVAAVGAPVSPVPFTFSGDQVELGSYVGGDWYPARDGRFDVVYSHGYPAGQIPDDIVAVVCQVAGRAFGVPADQSSRQQESIAGYSYSVGAAASAGPFGLLLGERQVLDRYRRTAGTVFLL